MRESYTQREWDRIVSWGNPPPNPVVNYIVRHGMNTGTVYYCETVAEVWDALGNHWGGCDIESPPGKDLSEFTL